MLSVLNGYADQDPMKPPSWFTSVPVAPITRTDLELQQVLLAKDRKIAIINNTMLREGESIAGVEVLKIERHRIRVRQNGVNRYIPLLPIAKEVNREI